VGLVAMMADPSDDAELIDKISQYWSLDITQDDIDEIRALEPSVGLSYALARVLSKNYTVIGWTTHGHNGETVPVWVRGGEAPIGVIDNTDLATIASEAMGVNLARATGRLYVDLDDVINDYEIIGDPEIGPYGLLNNLMLKVKGAELPISKDYMVYKGWTIRLPGITVYAPETGKVYVSKKALRIITFL